MTTQSSQPVVRALTAYGKVIVVSGQDGICAENFYLAPAAGPSYYLGELQALWSGVLEQLPKAMFTTTFCETSDGIQFGWALLCCGSNPATKAADKFHVRLFPDTRLAERAAAGHDRFPSRMSVEAFLVHIAWMERYQLHSSELVDSALL